MGVRLIFFLVAFPAKTNIEMWGAGSLCERFVRRLDNNVFFTRCSLIYSLNRLRFEQTAFSSREFEQVIDLFFL